MREVVMPASGMAMTEGLLVQWLKQPGESVRQGEPIAEIETDKATMEIESPAGGRLGRHLFEPGTAVPTGVPIVHILEEGDQGAEQPGEALSQEAPARVPAGVAEGSAVPAASSPVLEEIPTPEVPQEVPVHGTGGMITVTRAPADAADAGRGVPAATASINEQRRRMIPQPPPLPAGSPGAGSSAVGGTRAAPDGARPEAAETDTVTAARGDAEDLLPIDVGGLEPRALVEWLETMVLIREFEQAADPLAAAGKIPGGMHSAAGQEAVAVGAIRALRPTDIVTSSHRSHHHSLAKGLTPRSIMAELYGKATGCMGGRAGHMHLADFSLGLFGSNGIVGGGLGLAMGAALAAQMRRVDQVTLGFFGDGGANTGRVWEDINLASLWGLPLIVMCENNLYAVETYVHRAMAGESIARRASGFGLPCVVVDGQDVAAVYRATTEARARAVAGDGPTFIEAQTYRYEGHNTGDVGNYRTRDEIERWRRTRDPLVRMQQALEAAGILAAGQYDAIVDATRRTVADAIGFAEESPWPDPATALDNVVGIEVSEENL